MQGCPIPINLKALSPQVVPLRATVAVPELQLSTSWVDFGTCFVNEGRVREVYLMNLSGCRSSWTVLMGMSCPLCSRARSPRKGPLYPVPAAWLPRAGTTWESLQRWPGPHPR